MLIEPIQINSTIETSWHKECNGIKSFLSCLKELMNTKILQNYTGEYRGEGLNHEGEKFQGAFSLNYHQVLKSFHIRFHATGISGEVFHSEESTIAPSLMKKWTLWNLNSNAPGLIAHELVEETETAEYTVFKFTYGDPQNTNMFRETITLTVFRDGHIHYLYSWGLPTGDFKERSGAHMYKIS